MGVKIPRTSGNFPKLSVIFPSPSVLFTPNECKKSTRTI